MPFLQLTDAYGQFAVVPVEYPAGVRRISRDIVGDEGEWTVHDTYLSSIAGRKWGFTITAWGLTEAQSTALLAVLEGQPPLRMGGDLVAALLGDGYTDLRVLSGPSERVFVRHAMGHRVRHTFDLLQL